MWNTAILNFCQRDVLHLKTIAAWFCIAGGFLWGMKPLYDWLVLDRTINTGYLASDVTDYVKFAFPLLCLGGIFVLFLLYRKVVAKSAVILAAAIISNGLFHFFEIYAPNSAVPFGLLFMFSGTALLLIGAFVLVRELKNRPEVPRTLFQSAQALFTATLLFCIFPFVSGLLSDAAATPVLVVLMMAVGWIWAGIGIVLLKEVRKESAGEKSAVV